MLLATCGRNTWSQPNWIRLWIVCYILPVAAGILIQPHVNLKSEVLSWAIILLIVVVLFVLLQMVKPFFQKKKSTIQAIDQIKQYYYERYKKYGLDKMEPWN